MKQHDSNYHGKTVTLTCHENGWSVTLVDPCDKVFLEYREVVNELAKQFGLVQIGEELVVSSAGL